MNLPIDQALRLAVQHHQAGRLREAEAVYRQVLSQQAGHVEAMQFLARLYHQAGQPALAADWLKKVAGIRPDSVPVFTNLGLMLSMAGRNAEAIAAFRRALELNPNNPDVHNSLGALLQQAGDADGAMQAYQRALALRPTYPEAHHNLGNVLSARNRWDEAIASYRNAIAHRPNYAEAYNNLGSALEHVGQLQEAIAAYRQALSIRPDYPEAQNNLGSALRAAGDLDGAIGACQRAIALRPNYAEAYANLGSALGDKGLYDQAIGVLVRSLQLKPGFAEAHFNLANVLRESGRLDDAIAEYERALQSRPGFAEALNNLGLAYREQGRLDEALEAFERALVVPGDSPGARNNIATTLKDAGDLDGAIAQYRSAIAANPPAAAGQSAFDAQVAGNLAGMLHFHPDYDMRQIYEAHARWNEVYARSFRASIRPHENDRTPDRRLRVGYVSPDFRGHVVGRNMLPLFREHDHQNFEIFCYSNVTRRDAITDQFKSMADGWRDIRHLNDDQAAELIRQDRIDILVDLALHMAGNRLMVFARKPAPVQVTFAGYPGTTGLETIDYRLTDPYLDPPGLFDAYYSEQSIRLPHSFWCYEPEPGVAVNPLPAMENGYVTFGCLNNFCKVTEPTLRLWANVLRSTPASKLLLLSRSGRHRQKPLEMLRSEGIEAERVQFVDVQPREQYLGTYHRIDIALDTFPYNGHTTSLDALWMGVPVVTTIGTTVAGRAGWSQLNNLGLTELAATDHKEFVAIATSLANDQPKLAGLRATLRDRMLQSPLCDAKGFARGIEAANRQMWETSCSR